jgi:hypothetical protein
MERQRQTFSIALMARVLRVSRSAFYAWRRPRRTNPRATQRQALDERVKATFRAHMGRYGAPKSATARRAVGLVKAPRGGRWSYERA